MKIKILWVLYDPSSTHYFNSPKQDPKVGSQKRVFKYQFMQSTLELVVLEYYLLNHNQGIKIKKTSHLLFEHHVKREMFFLSLFFLLEIWTNELHIWLKVHKD